MAPAFSKFVCLSWLGLPPPQASRGKRLARLGLFLVAFLGIAFALLGLAGCKPHGPNQETSQPGPASSQDSPPSKGPQPEKSPPAIHSNQLKIAFVFSKAPYTIAEDPTEVIDPYSPSADQRTGIQIDLVKAALEGSGYTFTAVFQPYNRIILNLSDPRGSLDAGEIITLNQPGIHYSNLLHAFHNYAVTRKSAGLAFKTLEDLKGHSLAAWQGASLQLGPDFYNTLVKDNPVYYECPDQKAQYQMFVQHHVEVLIIDKFIFTWWDRKNPKREPVDFHPLFSSGNNTYLGFRDPKIRDIFDAGLARIRQSGEWDRIFEKYVGEEKTLPVPEATPASAAPAP